MAAVQALVGFSAEAHVAGESRDEVLGFHAGLELRYRWFLGLPVRVFWLAAVPGTDGRSVARTCWLDPR